MVIGIDASRAFGTERTGTENYSYYLITQMLQLPTAKLHTFVLFTRPNTQIPKELDGFSNVIIKTINKKYLWTQIGLAMATWRLKLDVLWIPAHTLPILRKFGLKTVVTIHGMEYRWLPEYANLLQRWYLPLSTFYAAKHATKLICVSEATKRDLMEEIQIDAKRIIVIHEGVWKSVEQGEGEPGKWLMNNGLRQGKYFLFVGTIQPRKNLGSLIRAFAKFYQQHRDYRLVIAGAVGWQANLDLALPEQLGIPEAVIFTGRISQGNLQTLYLGAAAYIQPSWTEGFGLPVLEAMKMGVLVIVSDGGALPEVVGDAGIVVPLATREGFETKLLMAMQSVVGESEMVKKMEARGKRRVDAMTWENAATNTLEMLSNIG